MPQLDSLSPDQRAVLSLVLDKGKSYGEVAELLGLSEDAVREWAHAALDALAGAHAPVAAANGARSAATAARAAAATVEAPPAPSRKTIAAEEQPAPPKPAPAARETDAGNDPPVGPVEPGTALGTSPQRASGARAGSAPGSRRGGALLLAGILVAIVVAVVLLSGGGGGKSSTPAPSPTANGSSPATGSAPGSTGGSSSAGGNPTVDKRFTLTSPQPGSKATGIGFVLSESSRRAFYVAAQNLPPSSGFFYAVWLYDSPSKSAPLGRAPAVGSNGRMEGGGPLPSNASAYSELIVTRETSTRPSRPGPIVLSGPFALH
jgi:Sigma-70, region 4